MEQSVREKIAAAVEYEKKNKEYAENFYHAEAVMARHFVFDTALLDRLILPSSRVFVAMMARGRHVLHFSRKGCEVWGNDHNKHMVGLVRTELRKEGLKAKLLSSDVTNLNGVSDDYFDSTICMFSSLGCIPGSGNRQEAVNELTRITKPGGRVIVHAHNRLGDFFSPSEILGTAKQYIFGVKGMVLGDFIYESGSLGKTYLHWFSPDEFRKLFSRAGLEVEKEFYLNKKQDSYVTGPLKELISGAFIFVGRKPISSL